MRFIARESTIRVVTYTLIFLMLTNFLIAATGIHNINIHATTYYWAVLLYTYTFIPTLVLIVILTIGIVVTKTFSEKSRRFRITHYSFLAASILFGVLASVGLLGRAAHVNGVSLGDHRYYLAKQSSFEFSQGISWGDRICECDQVGFACRCSYLDRSDYTEAFTNPRLVISEETQTLEIKTDQATYALIDECTITQYGENRGRCPSFRTFPESQ